MRRDAGRTDSFWEPIHDIPTDGPLERDVRADVCVVGAGLAGLCTAYELMVQAKRVVVVDDGPVGGGETARLPGHVRTVPRRLAAFVRAHGVRTTSGVMEAHADALDWLQALVVREGISCGFQRVPGHAVPEPGEEGMAREVGLRPETVDTPLGPALRHGGQAVLDPTLLASALAGILRAGGVRIHTSTHAARLDGAVVTSAGHAIRSEHVVEATNAPVFSHAGLPQQAYRRYTVAAEAPLDDALYWGAHDVRRVDGHVFISGGDHPTGIDPDHSTTFGALEAWGRETLGTGHTTHRWSRQVWVPQDGRPFLGRDGGSFIIAGDADDHVLHAALAARLIGQQVAGHEEPWHALFAPRRDDLPMLDPTPRDKRLRAARRRVLMPGDVRDESEIGRGQGAIMRRGIRLFACARDEDGALHKNLAVCAHDGCIVAWNAAEKTWDCPCDGSRYTHDGTVINAPANVDLGSYSPQPGDGVATHPPTERVVERGRLAADT